VSASYADSAPSQALGVMRFIIDAMTPPHATRAPSIRETREGEDPRPATNVSATKVFRRPKWAAL